MRLDLRAVVALLLAITVPIQAVVAATIAHCCPTTQQVAGAVSSHPGDDHARMMVASMQDHQRVAAHLDARSTPVSGPGQFDIDLSQSDPYKVAKGHGGGSCCALPAIPSRPLALECVTQREYFAPFGPDSVSAFLTEGLERPPRFLVA